MIFKAFHTFRLCELLLGVLQGFGYCSKDFASEHRTPFRNSFYTGSFRPKFPSRFSKPQFPCQYSWPTLFSPTSCRLHGKPASSLVYRLINLEPVKEKMTKHTSMAN